MVIDSGVVLLIGPGGAVERLGVCRATPDVGIEIALGTALRRKLAVIAEQAVPCDDFFHHLGQVKVMKMSLDVKRCLAKTELAGHADAASRAPGTRPLAGLTGLP